MKSIIPILVKFFDSLTTYGLPIILELSTAFRRRVLRRGWRFDDSPALAAELYYIIRFLPPAGDWVDVAQLRQHSLWTQRRFSQVLALGLQRGLLEREQYRAGGRLAWRYRLTEHGKRYLR